MLRYLKNSNTSFKRDLIQFNENVFRNFEKKTNKQTRRLGM